MPITGTQKYVGQISANNLQEIISLTEGKALITEVSGGTTYIGKAPPGSVTSAARWQIGRVVVAGGTTTITWADGNITYDNVWDDRATLTYL
ncbi:hypothetical protein CMI37_02435 [Candidatus Pacearchaeota archaeon]|nr:hypothetical protein [Candidatus Pacearchaeota archaeon]|tara:strand:+ start:15787 stop:16062 length:276 start_codon:yes stop_codon:yes gene_type:complete